MNGGVIRRVNGPLVEVDRLPSTAMAEVVELGAERIPAEVVELAGGRATTQAYEYTGGLAVGHPVTGTGRPLSAVLTPGLTGRVFDGLLRPLSDAPTWLRPGTLQSNVDALARWRFVPHTSVGQRVGPGDVLGHVTDVGPITHRVLVPPGLSGVVSSLCTTGECGPDTPVAVVEGTPVRLAIRWPVRTPRPFRARIGADTPLLTGQRVLDALFPITKGGTAAVPGGFGTGKTVLLQQIAKWCDADVIVYIGCGERGNELADVLGDLRGLTDPRTGGALADRTVIIANTSNMPLMAREASIHTGVTVAEYYRDMGHHAVVIADSTSRWAEALREFASRTGALPAEEGYPAGLASALAAFYERAGQVQTLGGAVGSVTIVGAVSPAGGDLTEPVTTHTQRFVRTLWTLDRDLAYARHYPAVTWTGSYCRDAERIGAWHARRGDPGWAARRARMVWLLTEADRLSTLAELVGLAALPGPERVTLVAGRLLREAVLAQSALSDHDGQCSAAKSAALADLVLDVVTRCDERVRAGVAASTIEQVDFSAVTRAREESGPDDVTLAARCLATTLATLDSLR